MEVAWQIGLDIDWKTVPVRIGINMELFCVRLEHPVFFQWQSVFFHINVSAFNGFFVFFLPDSGAFF